MGLDFVHWALNGSLCFAKCFEREREAIILLITVPLENNVFDEELKRHSHLKKIMIDISFK